MKKFFVSSVKSVEDLTIRMAIQSSGLPLFDTHEAQERGDFADVLREQIAGYDCYFLPGVPFATIASSPAHTVTIINSDGVPGKMSVLGQVLAIINREPTPYEAAICIYASGGIPALLAAGVQEEIIRQIALRDRFTRGGTIKDESIAAHLLDLTPPAEDTASALTYFINYCDPFHLQHVASSIVHHAQIIAAGRKITVVFRDTESSDIADFFRFTSD